MAFSFCSLNMLSRSESLKNLRHDIDESLVLLTQKDIYLFRTESKDIFDTSSMKKEVSLVSCKEVQPLKR